MKKRFHPLAVLALALCGVGIGIVITYTALTGTLNRYVAQAQVREAYGEDTKKLQDILAYLDAYFVEDISDHAALVDGAAAGLIAATGDRWSHYISRDDMAAYTEQLYNSYAGIGVTISSGEPVEEGYQVMELTPGGPAQLAGVQVGDILTQVEGESVAELGLDETKARVRGETGTDVTLTFLREGAAYQVTITRGTVEVPVVTWELLDSGEGLITIENFDNGCAKGAKQAIDALMAQGASALVFDVRNNPGGLRSELSQLLDYLLPEGIIFQSVDYKGDTSMDTSDPAFISLPMAVLVNENSYSAAEYFAACLQEYGAALVAGVQTSGKGYYQQTFPLDDGSAVAISTGAYYTPQGVSLADVGITPDVEQALDEEAFALLFYDQLERSEDDQLQAALAALAQ